MKHKRLFKIFSFIENLTTLIIVTFLIIYVVGEPVGDYTIKIFIFKILAMIGIYIIAKIEGGENL